MQSNYYEKYLKYKKKYLDLLIQQGGGDICQINLPKSPETTIGGFMEFYMDYKKQNPEEQAQKIIAATKDLIAKNKEIKGVGITYSANGDQTDAINAAYATGIKKGNESLSMIGSNQAEVMIELLRLLKNPENEEIRGKFRILPITTIYYNRKGIYAEDVPKDLASIETLINEGWLCLGWTNNERDTFGTKQFRWAVGGGIAKKEMPSKIDELIQSTLHDYHQTYTQYGQTYPPS